MGWRVGLSYAFGPNIIGGVEYDYVRVEFGNGAARAGHRRALIIRPRSAERNLQTRFQVRPLRLQLASRWRGRTARNGISALALPYTGNLPRSRP